MKNRWLWSLSTTVILISLMLSVLSITILFPWSILFNFIKNPQGISRINYLQLFFGGGIVIWSTLIFAFLHFWQLNRNENYLEGTLLINLQEYANLSICVDRLRRFGVYELTEYRLDGTNPNIRDEPERLISETPQVLSTLKKKGRKPYVVIIPPSFWARFKNYPEALSAVLVHESAHFQNRDIALLFSVSRFILIVFSLALIYLGIALYSSILSDSPSFSIPAILASLIGKNYLVIAVTLFPILYLMRGKLEDWREALADREAIRICGEGALSEAKKLFRNPSLKRPSRNAVQRALRLTPSWVFLIGFITYATSSRAAGVLAYLQGEIISSESAVNFVISILAVPIYFLSFYLCYFYVLAVLSRQAIEEKHSAVATLARNAIFLVLASSLGYLFLEVLPLALPSLFMPEGYDYIKRVDVNFSFFSHAILSSLISDSNLVLLASFGAWLAASLRKFWIGILPGLCWAIFSSLESRLIPYLMEGKLAILSTSIVMATLLVLNRRSISLRIVSGINYLLFVPLVLLVIAGRMGYGDVGHLAACYSQAGFLKMRAGEISQAIYFYEKATEDAPRQPQAWMDLAIALRQDNRLREAAEVADRAVVAPFNFHWDEKLSSLALAGNFRLELRESGDLEIARRYYKQAEQMWLQNSRLSREQVSSVLYNLACLYAIRDQNTLEATVYLVKASAINPKMASYAITDPDLSILNLSNQKPLSHEEIEKLENLSVEISSPILRKLVQQGELSEAILLRFVVFIANS